jgi:2-oxoacid dehydrogenases acyltransferase (catalytic domain)
MYKENKFNYFARGFADRYDGWRIRKVDPIFSVVPFMLRTRTDSEIFFQEKITIDHLEAFIREHKAEMPDLSLMHIFMAGMIRVISQRPHLNRFVMWNKIFARNYLSFSIAVKRSMTDEGEETLIKPYFLPSDTLQDVVRKVQVELENNKQVGQENSSDAISKVLGFLPDFLLRIVVSLIINLDKVGLMPKALNHASPFHTSLFLTNIGSIGIESVYHHLYEIGTCGSFIAMGKKKRETSIDKEGKTKVEKSIQLKIVLDERICDGFYYANSIRMLQKVLANPASLLLPPEKVIVDDGVGKKRIDL